MYDSVKLYLPEERAGTELLAHTPQLLECTTEHFRAGKVVISGYLNNLKVAVSNEGLSVNGSLAKYWMDDNIQTLRRQDTEQAIESLSDELHLPVSEANVSRVDFAHNFIMRYEPEVYYNYLGESQYFKRFNQPESLYYNNGNRVKLFYDKKSEAKAKAYELPEIWRGKHILRYEIRYKRRLSKQFKEPEVKAGTLPDEQFYIKLVDRYVSDYQDIHKNPQIHFDIEKMSSPKEFWRQLALMKVEEIGQNKLMELIDEWRAKDVFSKPEYYSRLKKEIRELCKKNETSESVPVIEELDSKISALKRYYR